MIFFKLLFMNLLSFNETGKSVVSIVVSIPLFPTADNVKTMHINVGKILNIKSYSLIMGFDHANF
jgi:hypothetical protein